ncbi:D-lactate dehydrogenase [Ketogulonicigenium robustum]|uniref:D-lactate dehydrogenase n=1 Tax=Ketogulonicigenium robustum TaxID=92947 RepID=A0A1W6NXH4_9RHOB|nr:D-lactate dehydrogenase [Ketogulonicigenium robustum]ARO13891.1 D-lactate dehydrogenase [Ketogulonicigenium robustum]
MTELSAADLIARLTEVVGAAHVLTAPDMMAPFTHGYRFGAGPAVAVVRPGSLLEQWRAFKLCVESGRIIIMQAANTGLNGGSTPFDDQYDREVVVISGMRLNRIDLLDGGNQVLCQPGATLHQLENTIKPLGRAPHSVIGSTTIGATVVGGVCNNSGGALIRRGPAYTQLSLFARVTADGRAELVNHLGINLGDDAETILSRLDAGDYTAADVIHDAGKRASDPDYQQLVRDVDAPTPARYNNDPRLLFEAAGSAGKLCVFAVRIDTFPSGGPSTVFYVASNDFAELGALRRAALTEFATPPVAGEYIRRDAYDLATKYGKDIFLFLKYAGTEKMQLAYRMKSRFDAFTKRIGLGDTLSDVVLNGLMRIWPNHLPKRMNAFAEKYEHHVLLRMDGDGVAEARAWLGAHFPSATGDFFECTEAEAADAFRHRYAVAGSSVRYRAVHHKRLDNLVSLDMALPRNVQDWREDLPADVPAKVEMTMAAGHFLCMVFHYDYAIKKGFHWHEVEADIIAHLAKNGVEFPSEHNVGHLYQAKPALADFYRSLDPTNTMNPGIGRTTRKRNWAN